MPILPNFQQARFVPGAPIDNPYMSLVPGTVSAFSGITADGETTEGNDYFVTSLTKKVMGVKTFVIRDTAYEDGILVEDTIDYFAQDKKGNVWYFGEKVINYRYDDEGEFLGTDSDGEWQAGQDGALPGWIMPARPTEGLSYFNEYAPGVAVDEALVVKLGEEIETELGEFTTLKTLDTSALSPGVREFKYYAPDVGLVRVEEGLDANGDPELVVDLMDVISAGEEELPEGTEELEKDDFVSDGTKQWLMVLSENSELNNSLGYYTFNLSTGVIGEGRILFDADEAEPGDQFAIHAAKGKGIGLFMVPDGAELGVDLSEYKDGGLFFSNMLTGGPARLSNGMAPIVTDADGNPLPIPVFHALGARNEANLLNPGLGLQAVEWELQEEGPEQVVVIGFEDQRRTQEDYDGDFDDFVVAYSNWSIDLPLAGAPDWISASAMQTF